MISLPPDLEKAVERHVASGKFRTAEDVLRAALDQLDSNDIESLKESLADEQEGRMKPLSDVTNSIREKHGFAESV